MMQKKLFLCFFATLFIFLILPFSSNADAEGLSVSAKAAVLIEADTGRVLFSKNKDMQLPMASTTKILTALITLESDGLDDLFVVDEKAIQVEGSSMGLRAGDSASLRTLACGMLLPSGNDAANAAAVRIGGSIAEFAAIMNQRAAAIGMKNSHFVTPSGLDNEQHYSTAYDMAKLARVALKNNAFQDICSRNIAKVEFGNPPYERWLKNHNRLLNEYKGAIGVKTGFTKKSGRCLVSAAERDGVTLIAVTLNAPNDWQDHTLMFNYGFNDVKPQQYHLQYEDIQLDIVGGKSAKVGVVPLTSTMVNVEENRLKDITPKVIAEHFYYAPVHAGDVMGKIELYLDGEEIGTTALIAAEDVKRDVTEIKYSLWDKIKMWFVNLKYKIIHYISGLLQ